MECRMSYTEESWSCQISIRLEFDQDGKKTEQTKELPFGPRISEANKGEVEIALRKAQYCNLNPGVAFQEVIDMDVEEFKQACQTKELLPFSKNVVCIDLQGPDMVDLSFIDLPGIIQNAEPSTVQLVQGMVEDHISGNCIILVTLPMTDDIENQKALQLARIADPHGRRTIGVLTKPDMLTEGSIQTKNRWLEILEGRSRHKLVHGYYCTRQLDDSQRAALIAPTEARKLEKEFFKKTSPWNQSASQDRFGTDQLISTVSNLLIGIINDSALSFRTETARMLQIAHDQLTSLPPAITIEPATYTLQMISSFTDNVKQYVAGMQGKEGLLLYTKSVYGSFREQIHGTRPNFKSESRPIDSDNKESILKKISSGRPFYLEDVRKHMQQSITRQLPGNVPFSTKVALIQKYQDKWSSFVDQCFDKVQTKYAGFLSRLIEQHFVRHASLVQRLKAIVQDLVSKHAKICQENLRTLLEMEVTPYTQNEHYFQESSAKWLARYKGDVLDDDDLGSRKAKRRREHSPPAQAVPKIVPTGGSADEDTDEAPEEYQTPNDQRTREVISSLASLGYIGVTPEDLAKLKPAHPYEAEIAMVAEVRGYFQVSYKRVIDNIPSMIDLKLVKAIANELQSFLIASLELGTQSASLRCAEYLEEDKAIVSRRTELQATKARLEEVEKELFKFGPRDGSTPMSEPPPVPEHLLRSHSNSVTAVHISEDNERLYSGDSSGLVIITSTRTLRALAKWMAHTDSLLGIEEWGERVITSASIPLERILHGRDHKLHVWKTLEDVPATSKIGGSAVTPEAQALTLCYSMDVNALNYCRFSLLGLQQDHSEAERSSEHRSQCLIALPNLVESSLADVWVLPSCQRVHAAIGKPPAQGTMADGRGAAGLIMSMHLFFAEVAFSEATSSTAKIDELRLLCAYENGSVTLRRYTGSTTSYSIEGRGWEAIWTAKLHAETIMSMRVSRDNSFALSTSADHLVGRYDLKSSSGSDSVVFRTKHPGNGAVAIRHDGRVCAVGGWDGKIRLYSSKNMKPLGTLNYHKKACQVIEFAHGSENLTLEESIVDDEGDEDDDGFGAVEKSARKRWLIGGSEDGRVSIWVLIDFTRG
ncbi:ASTRA complex subunit [Pleurotus pulmonarius]|nr:ASTRA complex subunit [Pleurotus pulmonarius]